VVLVGRRVAGAVGDAEQADFVQAVEDAEADVEGCVVEAGVVEGYSEDEMNAADAAEHIEAEFDFAEYFELAAADYKAVDNRLLSEAVHTFEFDCDAAAEVDAVADVAADNGLGEDYSAWYL
jgi:hypothetical protein